MTNNESLVMSLLIIAVIILFVAFAVNWVKSLERKAELEKVGYLVACGCNVHYDFAYEEFYVVSTDGSIVSIDAVYDYVRSPKKGNRSTDEIPVKL